MSDHGAQQSHASPHDAVYASLATVHDPELGIPITEMGLIYNITIANSTVTITMTLTTIGCPLFDVIHDAIRTAVLTVPGITDVIIDLTFDPPWDPSKMSDAARAEVGLD